MKLSITLAGFTPGEAEQLRRAMAAWRRNEGIIATFKERIVHGMVSNGYSHEFAETCMNQIKGFSEYGFPESHAASFALLVYASAWIKCHYPAEFAAALLNSQPMGFYAPSQIVRDAQQHGVTVLPIDVNHSGWDCRVEYGTTPAVRLGLRLVKGLGEVQARSLARVVESHGPYLTVYDLWRDARDAGVRKPTLQACARADAFRSMELSSRHAFWEIAALNDEPLTLQKLERISEEPALLPQLSLQQEMFQDYSATGLSLKAHPISFIRAELTTRGIQTAEELRTVPLPARRKVGVAGIGIIRQRPGTAGGMVFLTLEDETGISNLMIRPKVFEKFQKIVLSSACLLARGKLERVGEVVYVSAETIESVDHLVRERNPEIPLPNRSYSY